MKTFCFFAAATLAFVNAEAQQLKPNPSVSTKPTLGSQNATPAAAAPSCPQGTQRCDKQAIDADDNRVVQDVMRIKGDQQRGDAQAYQRDRQQYLNDFDKRQRDQQQLMNDLQRDERNARKPVPPPPPK